MHVIVKKEDIIDGESNKVVVLLEMSYDKINLTASLKVKYSLSDMLP